MLFMDGIRFCAITAFRSHDSKAHVRPLEVHVVQPYTVNEGLRPFSNYWALVVHIGLPAAKHLQG